MKPSEIVFDKNISNRDKFGVYVKDRRIELGMSLRYLSGLLEFSPAYMSDIENGNRPAPINHLDDMIKALKVEENEIDYFHDLAGSSHGYWPDINEYLGKMPHARKFLRIARDNNISEEEIYNLITGFKDQESLEK